MPLLLEVGRLYSHISTLAHPQTTAEITSASSEIVIEQVPNSEIVATVMGAVSGAQHGIKMTMLLHEERENPLPEAYHQLIKQKVNDGIQITRIGFGNKEDFEYVNANMGINAENFSFKRHPDTEVYQRLIMVDGEFLFFNFGNTYYRTRETSVIQQFQTYFERVSSQT